MDRDKLKEKIAQTIATVDGETDWDYVRSIPNHPIYGWAMEQAEAALTAIEDAGCVIVPIEPTDEMLKRMLGATRDHGAPDTSGGAAYRAALHASPFRNTENGNG